MSQPETILQFGAGRFLRAFIDRFVQQANDAGQNVGRIVVVQSTPGARAELLNQQRDGYHVLVRGLENGEIVDRAERVASISRAINAAGNWAEVLEVARSPELKYIVTNATEAGYALDPADRLDSAPPQSLPAKLTQVLWARFQAGGAPLVLLPCELIEQNAAKLKELVLGLARQWNLPGDFQAWINAQCWWLSNLVDCIVTAGPSDHPLSAEDPLLICAEPYALFAIERPAGKTPPLFSHPAIKLVAELAPYYLRKVRMLNGLHTAMVGKFLPAGFVTVQQVMQDPAATRWIRDLLYEEIVPTLAYRLEGVAEFADAVLDRFRNPFQAHKLTDIALHHADKVRVRLQPTRDEYERLFGRAPKRLSEAMAWAPAE
jgi:tagaturonate reductase